MYGLPTINQLNKNAADHAEAQRILADAAANPQPSKFDAVTDEALANLKAQKANGAQG